MADQTIAYTEEMVGRGHPTKADTLNRALLVEHGADGVHKSAFGLYRLQQLLDNLGIAATVGSNALTVALKGADGNNASSTNVVTIGFRSATLTTGTPVIRTVTGALSIVLSAGSTLGFAANEAGRIYIWAIDNAGTVELALSRTADIFPESNRVTTTAEGGAGAADSATVMYSTTARSNVACRCIGYIEITTGATPGNWSNAPTQIQIMGPGVKRTGDVVQVVRTSTGAYAQGAVAIPIDNTIPQITEGSSFMTLAITPTNAANLLYIDVCAFVSSSAANKVITGALFTVGVSDALAAMITYSGTEPHINNVNVRHRIIAASTSMRTYDYRCGTSDGTTMEFNGYMGALFGGTANSYFMITEVFA